MPHGRRGPGPAAAAPGAAAADRDVVHLPHWQASRCDPGPGEELLLRLL
jgi:hypothetical protein